MPIPVISLAQMRAWEQATWVSGQTEAEVIRRVGQCIGRRALRLTCPGDRVLILAGKGHNGDDARCAREELDQRLVEVLDVTDPGAHLYQLDANLSARPALVIDGLFGIGINRPLNAEWAEFIEHVNEARVPVLAVDVPSGLNGDTGQPQGAAIEASVTLTVGAPKIGMLQEPAWTYVGRLEVADDVGLAPCPCTSEMLWTVAEDFAGFPPPRGVATHKGTYGHVGLVAGSVGYHGAAVLTARGAQRAQPGLVTLHTVEQAYHPVASQLQAVMVAPRPPDDKQLESYQAVMVGPGLAAADVPEEIKTLTRKLWRELPSAMVVDASALGWLEPGPTPVGAVRVITPHPGEAARLLGSSSKEVQANRVQALRDLSKRFGNAWVVLKGHQTLIGRSSGEILVNSSGNPHLAQGGSGDVLSGYIAGLLTQPALQADPQKTLAYAVWQHGAAADRLQEKRRNWVVEELILELGAC